jgi:hypothetical protein
MKSTALIRPYPRPTPLSALPLKGVQWPPGRLTALGLQGLVFFVVGGLLWGGVATSVKAATADLQARHAALQVALTQSPFHRPLLLSSVETADRLSGDIDAVVDHPFAVLSSQLSSAAHWCDVMILHINTKYCRSGSGGPANPAGVVVNVSIGKKTPEVLTEAMRIAFNFDVVARTPDYFEVLLSAKQGPLGTSDYVLRLQAIALPASKTFVHLTYAYSANLLGRVAMRTYLGTAGRGKVGFTTLANSAGARSEGQPAYIDGMRALVERNAMRYYLAIDSYLQFTDEPVASQSEKRLQAWFTAIEQYPRQLHDVDRADYMQMKRDEVLRQQTTLVGATP